MNVVRAIPAHGESQRIGLLGGSFNPPHEAHRAISLFAMKRLRLDRVWWLVSPGNPLKENPSNDLDARLDAAAMLARHPQIAVTGFEATLRTHYTIDTLKALFARSPAHFVWIMGADNLAQFDRWRAWRQIADLVPIAVVDRGNDGIRALASPAAQALARHRIPEAAAMTLPDRTAPAWVFLSGLKLAASSTALRGADGRWLPAAAQHSA